MRGIQGCEVYEVNLGLSPRGIIMMQGGVVGESGCRC